MNIKQLLLICLPGFIFAQKTPANSSPFIFPASQSITRAVIIGISDYREPEIPDLRFADKDAEAVARFLYSEAGGNLKMDQVQVLTNQKATAGNIIAALTWLVTDSKPGDRVILSFSGHGDVEQITKNQWGYLLAHDAPAKVYPAGGTVPLPYLQDVIATLSEAGVNVFIISDACHAGKLAGSARGGAKATTAALAQQFSNEVKLLSCQPDEYSLEGEQWGGGRGCFSFHLLNALTGAADANEDGTVSLLEVGRYLEDKVTTDAAPQSQVPLSIGNRSTVLTKVHMPSLAAIQQPQKQAPIFSGGSMKGMEAAVLSGTDSTLQALYRRFEIALESGNLLDHSGNSANDLYLRLIREPALAQLHGAMTRNLAAALQNEAQIVINQLLATDPQVVDGAFSLVAKYDHLPAWLARAAELLGPKHYMFRYLKAREYFFRSKTFRTENYPNLTVDSLVHLQLACLDTALNFDAEAAYLHFEKGCVQYRNMNQPTEVFCVNFSKAMELSPEWVMPVYFLGRSYVDMLDDGNAKAVALLNKAIQLDSSFLPNYSAMGWATSGEERRRWLETYVHRLEEYERLNPGRVPVVYLNYLGNSLWQLGRYEEARTVLLKGEEISKGQFHTLYGNLGVVYVELGQYEEAEKSAMKLIELNPLGSEGYLQLTSIRLYLLKKQLETLPALYQKASQLGAGDYINNDLVWSAMQLGKIDSALLMAQAWLKQDTTNPQAILRIGQIHLRLGNDSLAQMAFQKLIRNRIFWGYNPPSYYQLIGHIRTKPWEKTQISLEKSRLNPNFPAAFHFWTACALAAHEKQEDALIWLESALEKGWRPNKSSFIDETLRNPDLDAIRQTARFKALVQQYLPIEAKYMRWE